MHAMIWRFRTGVWPVQRWVADGAVAAFVLGVGLLITRWAGGPEPFPVTANAATAVAPSLAVHVDFVVDGTGRAVLVTSGGQATLIDGGPTAAGLQVLSLLRQDGISALSSVVITSAASAAVDGLGPILRGIPVGQIYDAVPGANCAAYRRVLDVAQSGGIPVVPAARGTAVVVGGARLQVLLPAGELSHPGQLPAGPGLVALTAGGVRFLLAATVNPLDEEQAVRLGGDLRSQVLEVPGQGGPDALAPAFLEAVAPRLAIVYEASDQPAGSALLQRLATAGAAVLRPSLLGDLRFSVSDHGMTVSFHPGLPAVAVPTALATPGTGDAC